MSRSSILATPFDIPEVRNGYWWSPAATTGRGDTGFTMREMNGNTSFDGVQSTIAAQPTAIVSTANGKTHHQYTVSGTASAIRTAGSVQAGWTGTTYIAFRHRMTSGTPTSGTTTLFAHNTASVGLRRITIINNGTSELFTVTVSTDGTATQQNSWNATYSDAMPWLEFIFIPGSFVMYKDFVLQAPSSEAINITTLNDASSPIGIGCASGAANNVNVQDLSEAYYLQAVPSLRNRKFLSKYNRTI